MNTQLFIRLRPGFNLSRPDEEGNQVEWCWLDGTGTINGRVMAGTFSQLAEWFEGESPQHRELPVTLIVSGLLSSCARKGLLEGQRRHWQQALPYLFEEQLATDIDDLHIVAVADTSGESISAGWIANQHMTQLLDHFGGIGVELQHVLPESQFYEGTSGLISVWLEGQSSYIAAPENYGQLVDTSSLELLVPSLLSEDEPDKNELTVALDDDGEEETPDLATTAAGIFIFYVPQSADLAEKLAAIGGVSAEQRALDDGSLLCEILPILSERQKSRQLIDFRTGVFKSTSKSGKLWRQWRPVAIIALVWLVTEVTINVVSGFYYQHEAEKLMAENLATYRELRPNDKRTVDVQHGLTLFLKNATPANTSPVFLQALQKISAASKSSSNTVVWGIDFNEASHRLVLDMRAESFEALNRYAETLKAKGLTVSVENGNQDSWGVTARVIVRTA